MSRLQITDADLDAAAQHADEASGRLGDHGRRAASAARSRPAGRGRYARVAEEVVEGAERLGQGMGDALHKAADDVSLAARKVADDLRRADAELAARAKTADAGHEPRANADVRPQAAGDPPKIVPKHYKNPLDMVPSYATREPYNETPDGRYGHGFAYSWVDEWGREIRIHGHMRDTHAPKGAHSRSNPIFRVSVGKRFIDADGNAYHKNANKPTSPHHDPDYGDKTHMPWPPHVDMPR